MVKAPHKIAFFGPARDGRVQRRVQDEFGLFKRRQLVKVAQELQEPQIPRQIRFADAAKDPQRRLQQREQTLGPVFMHLTTRIFLLRMVDEVVRITPQCPIAPGRVGVEAPARLDRSVSRLLHCLDSTIPRCVHHDTAIAADPGNDGSRRPIS